MKLAIIYYSQTGHNFQMAKWAKEEAEKNGAEVRLLKVKEYLDEVEPITILLGKIFRRFKRNKKGHI